jgi:hypothetical protein
VAFARLENISAIKEYIKWLAYICLLLFSSFNTFFTFLLIASSPQVGLLFLKKFNTIGAKTFKSGSVKVSAIASLIFLDLLSSS